MKSLWKIEIVGWIVQDDDQQDPPADWDWSTVFIERRWQQFAMPGPTIICTKIDNDSKEVYSDWGRQLQEKEE